jgi:diguanylate cyclase (GGDEF)-like protein
MDIPKLYKQSANSPFAAQLERGFANLKFQGFLERDFQEVLFRQNLTRARYAALILLAAAIILTAVEWVADNAMTVDTGTAFRFFTIMPALGLIILATFYSALERHYTWIATVSASALGLAVVFKSQAAAAGGEDPFSTIGLVLVILYICLFPGLLFRISVVVAASLVVVYFALGAMLGVAIEPLAYATTLLAATVLISGLASYNLEYVLRMSFLETRLLNELAERDGLTGLYNRRVFDDFMRRLWRQSQREEVPLQIVFVDIDYFKIYNDLYGHQAGDDCLKRVARCIAESAKRPFDFAARYGGEEFVLVLYGPPQEHAHTVPEQVRLDVKDLAIGHEGSDVGDVVTVSVGAALAAPGTRRSLAGAIQMADEALYEAKRAGRDRLVCKSATDYEVETGKFRVVSG